MKKILPHLSAGIAALMLVASCGILGQVGGGGKTFTFDNLPQNLQQMQALTIADMSDPYAVAAMTIVALARHGSSSRDCFQMLNFLKGPESVSNYEFSFINERLQGKEYKPFNAPEDDESHLGITIIRQVGKQYSHSFTDGKNKIEIQL